jgi:hypothetical protein
MTLPKVIDHAVRTRADERCEYCLAPQSASKLRFWIDHIIPSQHLGPTTLDNLALSCPFCNRHKGPNIVGIDPVSTAYVPLFNPRLDEWDRHFQIHGDQIIGTSAIGRATVHVLAMNHPIQVLVRRAMLREGLFPGTLENN